MGNVRNFGAVGDGTTDDTAAIQHAIDQGEGVVDFPRGDYLLTRTIELDTAKTGRIGISGQLGTAKIIMAGPGPALRLVGHHAGTADPQSMQPEVWKAQRLPTVDGIEIEGRHAGADGIQLVGTVQAILRNVAIHATRHGVRLSKRNRNMLIEGCQIYHNRGAGIRFEGVNLHQINITGNHISYNRLGGIRIEQSEVRNLQITGNDIEYNTNRTHGIADTPTAEIYIDTTAPGASVNEVTIASNTIQAQPSPTGANIRIIEDGVTDRPPGLYAITGNVIGNQTNNVHLTGCYGITLTGNNIYSAGQQNVRLESCRQIIVSANQLRRHTPRLGTGMLLRNSQDCILGACQILDESAEGQAAGLALLQLDACQRVAINGCHVVGNGPHCLAVSDCDDVLVAGSLFVQGAAAPKGKAALHWTGQGSGNLVTGCRIRPGGEGGLFAEDSAGVTVKENLLGS